MPDLEKVIKGLEVCLKNIDQQDCPSDCPYLSDCSKYENRVIFQPLMRDALALLKEQAAVEPKEIVNEHFPIGDYRRTIGWLCGKCGKALMGDGVYCSYCGREVKWE